MPNVTGGRGSFGGARPSKDKDKSRSGVGAGTSAMTGDHFSDARDDPERISRPGGKTTATGNRQNPLAPGVIPMGGTIPPGATQDYADANAAAVADLLSGAIPGFGAGSLAYKGMKALTGEEKDPLSASNFGPLGDALGAETGKQTGWRADRYRGRDSLTGVGGSGGAVNSGERAIPGQRYGSSTAALVGDLDNVPNPYAGEFSDVVLKDRRKPRLTLSQAAMQLLG